MYINLINICFLSIFIVFYFSSSPLVYGQITQAQQYLIDDFIKDVKLNNARGVKKALDAGMSPNVADNRGNSALAIAIAEKSSDVAKLLINSPSIDLERPNLAGETPLMMAAYNGSYDLVVYLVTQRAVEVNHPGWSALHYASTNGHLEIVRFLLDKDAYVDPESPNGTTALMMAARGGHIHIVKLLIDRGANISISNQLNLTAIDFAIANNQTEIADGLKSRWFKLYGKPYPPKP
ncbi:MAG: ankyrin repeat protein [Pseudomonadota bacterium]|jgi:ankyrin repeat protein